MENTSLGYFFFIIRWTQFTNLIFAEYIQQIYFQKIYSKNDFYVYASQCTKLEYKTKQSEFWQF